jgi:RND family efflux transporter MFP subunit
MLPQSPTIVLIALTAAAAGCGTQEHPIAAQAAPIETAVTTATVRPLRPYIESGGVVRARTTAIVTSRILAPVLEVRVAAGDRVRAGQVLVRLDDRDLAARLRVSRSQSAAAEQARVVADSERAAARAALTLAAVTHQRIATLHARRSATASELDAAVAGLDAAKARVQSADAQVVRSEAEAMAAGAAQDGASVGASWSAISAPFDGVVLDVPAEPGNMAAPGTPLVHLEDTSASRLEVRLDDSRTTGLAPGASVDIVFDVPSPPSGAGGSAAGAEAARTPVRAVGRVTEIARGPEAGPYASLVKVELPAEPRVPSGTYARARFVGPPREALTVVPSAVVRRGQLTFLYVVDGGRARLRVVTVGPESGDWTEILAGLDAGERVLANPPPGITDGAAIRATAPSPRDPAARAGEGR